MSHDFPQLRPLSNSCITLINQVRRIYSYIFLRIRGWTRYCCFQEQSMEQPSAPLEDSTLGVSTAAAIIDTEYGETTFATEEEGWGDDEDGLDDRL